MARPVITDLERSRADITLEWLAALTLIALLGAMIYYYPSLPENIPQHFNFSGQPDAWGGKGSLLPAPLTAAVIYLALTILSRFPHVFNYPWPITETNARRQYTLARQLLSALKLLVVVIFAYITWGQIATAVGRQSGLSPWFLFVSLPATFVVMAAYLVRAQRAA